MTEQQLDERLRRIEGLLAMLVRNADVERDERDLDGEIARAYRRGYLTGHHQRHAGVPCDPEAALRNRRRPRSQLPDLGPGGSQA